MAELREQQREWRQFMSAMAAAAPRVTADLADAGAPRVAGDAAARPAPVGDAPAETQMEGTA